MGKMCRIRHQELDIGATAGHAAWKDETIHIAGPTNKDFTKLKKYSKPKDQEELKQNR